MGVAGLFDQPSVCLGPSLLELTRANEALHLTIRRRLSPSGGPGAPQEAHPKRQREPSGVVAAKQTVTQATNRPMAVVLGA